MEVGGGCGAQDEVQQRGEDETAQKVILIPSYRKSTPKISPSESTFTLFDLDLMVRLLIQSSLARRYNCAAILFR